MNNLHEFFFLSFIFMDLCLFVFIKMSYDLTQAQDLFTIIVSFLFLPGEFIFPLNIHNHIKRKKKLDSCRFDDATFNTMKSDHGC